MSIVIRKVFRNFNPRSPWGERLIHGYIIPRGKYFNPRSPWGERLCLMLVQLGYLAFQSTLPVGGATIGIRSPELKDVISIHAPRGGSDNAVRTAVGSFGRFQSTLPVGGATVMSAVLVSAPAHFNPRSPWGERHADTANAAIPKIFQSTLPVGGATLAALCADAGVTISIHAPRGGSDNTLRIATPIHSNFNPRSPWGERLLRGQTIQIVTKDFNPRSPWGERPFLFQIA